MTKIKFVLLLTGLCFASSSFSQETDNPALLLTQWNQALLEVAEQEDGFLTLKGLRTAAMMHLSMHQSLSDIKNDQNAMLAANEAALTVVLSQYPDQQKTWQTIHQHWQSQVGKVRRPKAWQARGVKQANSVMSARDGDGWNTEAEYRWHPMAPGVYAEFKDHSGTPEGFIFGTGWAKARGFALKSSDEFRVPPPPAIQSQEYVQAYDEVKSVGRFQSLKRAPDQTHLALWWKDFVENSHNRLARQLTVERNLSLRHTAKLFALLNAAIFDAYVSSFENKFFYNHWRPFTAIRWADNDGNSKTVAEATWNNTHRHTYAFPSYPSAHGTACASAMAVMTEVIGDDVAFTMSTPMVDIAGPLSEKIEMHPPTRSFDSFYEAAEECALSRVYLGIHFRYDSVAGFDLGKRVGEAVVQRMTDR